MIARSQWRGALLGLAAAGSLMAGSGTAWAQSLGETVSGVLTVAGKQVPLPAGSFTVIATDTVPVRAFKRGEEAERLDFGPVRSVTLAQVSEGRVGAVVEVHANLLPYHDGWGAAVDCSRTDLYAAVMYHKSGWDVSCLYVKSLATGGTVSGPGGVPLAGFARASNATVTDFWVTAGLRVANRHDVLDVRYNFDPALLGAPASAAEAGLWEPAGIEDRPQQLAAVKDIAAWTAGVANHLDEGLRGRLTETRFPDVAGAAAAGVDDPATASRETRRAALRQLRDAGAITEQEFLDQQTLLDAEVAVDDGSDTWTYAQVAGWKAFTYRVVVTTINAGIDYVFIGQPFAAGVLVILQVVVNTTKFFFHEMMWQEVFGISPLQRDGPQVIEFGRTIVAASATR